MLLFACMQPSNVCWKFESGTLASNFQAIHMVTIDMEPGRHIAAGELEALPHAAALIAS